MLTGDPPPVSYDGLPAATPDGMSPAAPPLTGTRAGDPPPRKAVPWRSLPPSRPATEGACRTP